MKAIQLILFFLSFSIYSQSNQFATLQTSTSEIEFSIFPNPAKDFVTVQCNQPIEYIKLYNKQGKQVLKTIIKDNKINLTGLNDGFYLFCAYVNGKKIKKGILKKA